MSKEKEMGPLEGLLMFAGAIVGGINGYDINGFWGMVIGAVILGGIGAWIGQLTEKLIKFIALVVILLLNAAIRQFVFQFIRELLAS